MKKEGWDTICGFPVVSQPSSFEPCAFWLWQEHFQSQHLFFSFLFFYSRMTLRKKWRKYPKPILSSLLRNSPAFHSSTRLRLKRKSHFSQWLISLETGSPGLPVSKTARGADALNVRVSRCFSAIRRITGNSRRSVSRCWIPRGSVLVWAQKSKFKANRLNILSLSVDYLPNYSLYSLSQNAENVWIREPGSSVYKTHVVYILCHLAGWRVTSRQQLLQLLLHNS